MRSRGYVGSRGFTTSCGLFADCDHGPVRGCRHPAASVRRRRCGRPLGHRSGETPQPRMRGCTRGHGHTGSLATGQPGRSGRACPRRLADVHDAPDRAGPGCTGARRRPPGGRRRARPAWTLPGSGERLQSVVGRFGGLSVTCSRCVSGAARSRGPGTTRQAAPPAPGSPRCPGWTGAPGCVRPPTTGPSA